MEEREQIPNSKKIALLKKALRSEREGKAKDMQQIQDLENTVAVLEASLHEKESQIEFLNRENEQIEHLIGQMQGHSQSMTVQGAIPRQNKRSSMALEEQNRKLQEEYNFQKQHYDDMLDQYNKTKEEYDTLKTIIANKDDHLRKLVQELQVRYAELTRNNENIQSELKNATANYTGLTDQNTKLEQELEDLRVQLRSYNEQLEQLQEDIQGKEQEIQDLNSNLLRHSENEALLASKLMELKKSLQTSQQFYQKYDVTKLNNVTYNPAKLILKRNNHGDFVLEMQERREVTTYNITSIADISMNPNTDRRFTIRIYGEGEKEFDTPQAEKIIKNVRSFINRAANSQLLQGVLIFYVFAVFIY